MHNPYGQPYKLTDKAIILNEIAALTNKSQKIVAHASSLPNEGYSIVVFEGMLIVNSVSIKRKYSNYFEAIQISIQIILESQGFSEFSVIFENKRQ